MTTQVHAYVGLLKGSLVILGHIALLTPLDGYTAIILDDFMFPPNACLLYTSDAADE